MKWNGIGPLVPTKGGDFQSFRMRFLKYKVEVEVKIENKESTPPSQISKRPLSEE
jgi:hypothetical protein